MKGFKFFSRHSYGVRNVSPWRSMLGHALHQFHENDLFTSAAAMSYFGLMALFPALLLLFAISNKLAAGSQMLAQAVDVYPGSAKFLRDTVGAFSEISVGAIITCIVLVLWAGSWVFAVVERAVNRIWGTVSRTFLHGRALTIGMVGLVGLLLSVSVVITSALVALRGLASSFSPRQIERYTLLTSAGSAFWQVIFFIASYAVTVALFVLVYRFMPRADVTLRDTIPGALLVVGVSKVHLCLEPRILPLRSDLWIGWRGGRGANVELRFESDSAAWGADDSSVSLRTPVINAHLRIRLRTS
jgi:membrane protein